MFSFFFFNDTATTEIYTLSLHDALPIWTALAPPEKPGLRSPDPLESAACPGGRVAGRRSEEHTSELQSHVNLVCRLLLEKKKKNKQSTSFRTAQKSAVVHRSLLIIIHVS